MARSHKIKTGDQDLLKLLSSDAIGSIGNYVFGKTLGEGTFGKVKLARHVLTGQEVAVKIVDKMHAPTLVREIETWRHMHHPNIIRLYEILCSESRIYMVMEYCTGGEAFDYICEHGKFDDQSVDAKRVVKQLVEAVGYCHDKDFVHRDLKLENVLLTTDLNVKLIDFGFTRRVNTRNLLDTYCGSVAYAAPEMILGKRYSGPQADVWSLGVILYTLLCGYLPFDDDSEAAIRQKILELDYELPDFLSADTKDLIQEMLKIEGPERIGINDILAHPWFASITERGAGPQAEPEDTITVDSTPGKTPDELLLLRKLTLLGFDVASLTRSVKKNACDQSSALWYLLLSKQTQAETVAPLDEPPPSPFPESYPTSPVVINAPEITSSDYLARMRKKTLGDSGRSTDDESNSDSTSAGRRGLIMNAMRTTHSSSPGSNNSGGGRRRRDNSRTNGESRPIVNRSLSEPTRGYITPPMKQGWVTEEDESEQADLSPNSPDAELDTSRNAMDAMPLVKDDNNIPALPTTPSYVARSRPVAIGQGLLKAPDRAKRTQRTWVEETEEEEEETSKVERLREVQAFRAG